MTEAFLVLPKEKRKAILDAAATEFAEHGYKEASTNRIVQAAGIGKGMLFYYFGSKLELYLALLERVGELVEAACEKLLHHPEQLGILETFRHATRVKMEMYLEEPALLDFVARLYLHPEEVSVTEEAARRFSNFTALRERVMKELFGKADLSKLRTDIPQERLVSYLSWAMEGYTQHLTGLIRRNYAGRFSETDMSVYWDEYDIYMEDLKLMFYKGDLK